MKKIVWGTILLYLLIAFPISAMAQVNINVGISLPPPIVFHAPPAVVVLPDANDVYVVPDIDVDLFFWNGWCWRLWEGRWYRSHYYDRGWAYYNSVPTFYFDVDPGWRVYYREHNWHGHRWNYDRVPYPRLQQNWKSWHNNRHWERQVTWGIQNYQPRPPHQKQELRHQREVEYRQKPEVQRHQKQMQEQQSQRQQRQPEAQKPQGRQERQPRVQQPQRRQPEKGPQHRQIEEGVGG